MIQDLQERFVICPYCWEQVSLLLDVSGGSQEYVEDCEVCCRPILVRCTVDEDGSVAVTADQENQ